LKIVAEVLEGLDTLGCTSPVPDSDSVINVSGPVKQPLGIGGAKLLFMGVKKECCPHACRWSSHGGARELLPVGVQELENVIVHDEGESFTEVDWKFVKLLQAGASWYVGVHANCITGKEKSSGWEQGSFLKLLEAGEVI